MRAGLLWTRSKFGQCIFLYVDLIEINIKLILLGRSELKVKKFIDYKIYFYKLI